MRKKLGSRKKDTALGISTISEKIKNDEGGKNKSSKSRIPSFRRRRGQKENSSVKSDVLEIVDDSSIISGSLCSNNGEDEMSADESMSSIVSDRNIDDSFQSGNESSDDEASLPSTTNYLALS